MNRQEKSQVIETLKGDFSASQASFLVGLKGLTVVQLQTLRKELRAKGGRLQVAKARLMKKAVEGMGGRQDMSPFFKEQVGLVFASAQFTDVAKVLSDFSKQNDKLVLVVGCLGEQVVPKTKIAQIASLPPREVLLAQVCGTLKAPITGLATSLNQVTLKLLWTLNAVGQTKQ